MKKQAQPIEAEIFTYEEYRVYELLKSKDNSIKISGQRFGKEISPFDLEASDGIPSLGLSGKTGVEVKTNLSFATIKEISVLFDERGAEYNILVVYFDSSVSNIPSTISNSSGRSIVYKSYHELKKEYKKRKDTDRSDYYVEKAKKGDWRQVRDNLIEEAKEIVTQGSNVLFLGAGISISAGMPSWKDLLKGLMGEVKKLKSPTLEAFKELSSHVLEECGDSNLIMGRYLQTAISLYDKKAVFSELIQKHLYNDKDSSPLLVNLARIVQQKKVNEVITYNFDDLLEQNLAKIKLTDSVDYTSISKDAEIKGHNTLPIYHVHGIIPKEGPVDTVVFSEAEYHKRYSTAFHWSNVEQLHALSRMHCFFIGLSMTDPNLRRLLDTAKEMNKTNRTNHFAFLRRTELEKYCVSNVNKTCKYVCVSESLIDKKKQKEIYDLNYAVIESIFGELGVNVIWYEKYDELPGLVAQVFNLNQYEEMGKKDLISLCDNTNKEIKTIEEFVKSNDKNVSIMVTYYLLKSARERASDYKQKISEATDMLNVLSEGIDWEKKGSELMKMVQEKEPINSKVLNGWGDFFQYWLDNIKGFYEL